VASARRRVQVVADIEAHGADWRAIANSETNGVRVVAAEQASLRRLVEKHAATRVELQTVADKIRQTELAIAGLEKRRTSLVAKPDVAAAQARLQDTEVALNLARQRAAQSVVRAPSQA